MTLLHKITSKVKIKDTGLPFNKDLKCSFCDSKLMWTGNENGYNIYICLKCDKNNTELDNGLS